MKRIGFFICALCVCNIARGDTASINWYVDGTTYNTSTCTVGGDITLPTTPTKRGHTFRGWIPGYTEIEYLESTGTQYIDTGFKPNQNTRVSMEYMIPSCNTAAGFIYGVRAAYGSNDQFSAIYSGDNYLSFDHGVRTQCTQLTSAFYNNKLNLEMVTPNNLTITNATNGTQLVNCINNNNNSQSDFSLGLFGLNNGGNMGADTCNKKVYSFKIYDNDTLVRDMIPVKDMNNVPCMFDKVNYQFYYNVGTGTFTAGPEL